MGQTDRKYPIMEIGLSLISRSPLASGHERLQVGDIISVHPPSLGLGLKEVNVFLWLLVGDFEENEYAGLKQFIYQGSRFPGEKLLAENLYDKRRYCIPLKRLQKVYPVLDIARALDVNTIYQPFLPLDEDNMLFLEGRGEPPFSVHGLIFDKTIGDYI